jgi:hypothetical protein
MWGALGIYLVVGMCFGLLAACATMTTGSMLRWPKGFILIMAFLNFGITTYAWPYFIKEALDDDGPWRG